MIFFLFFSDFSVFHGEALDFLTLLWYHDEKNFPRRCANLKKKSVLLWPINNPMALYRGELTDYLLTVNGFLRCGGDFDQFRRLCLCGDRMPAHPAILALESAFGARFGCDLPLRSANAATLWKIASDQLLTEGNVLADSLPLPVFSAHPSHLLEEVKKPWPLEEIPAVGSSWEAWRADAERVVQAAISDGKQPFLTVCNDDSFVRADRYHAERHLLGVEKNPRLWDTQLMLFACDICAREQIPLGVLLEGGLARLMEILRYVSKFTELPRLLVAGGEITPQDMAALGSLILEKGSLSEGEPPVMLSLP